MFQQPFDEGRQGDHIPREEGEAAGTNGLPETAQIRADDKATAGHAFHRDQSKGIRGERRHDEYAVGIEGQGQILRLLDAAEIDRTLTINATEEVRRPGQQSCQGVLFIITEKKKRETAVNR